MSSNDLGSDANVKLSGWCVDMVMWWWIGWVLSYWCASSFSNQISLPWDQNCYSKPLRLSPNRKQKEGKHISVEVPLSQTPATNYLDVRSKQCRFVPSAGLVWWAGFSVSAGLASTVVATVSLLSVRACCKNSDKDRVRFHLWLRTAVSLLRACCKDLTRTESGFISGSVPSAFFPNRSLTSVSASLLQRSAKNRVGFHLWLSSKCMFFSGQQSHFCQCELAAKSWQEHTHLSSLFEFQRQFFSRHLLHSWSRSHFPWRAHDSSQLSPWPFERFEMLCSASPGVASLSCSPFCSDGAAPTKEHELMSPYPQHFEQTWSSTQFFNTCFHHFLHDTAATSSALASENSNKSRTGTERSPMFNGKSLEVLQIASIEPNCYTSRSRKVMLR